MYEIQEVNETRLESHIAIISVFKATLHKREEIIRLARKHFFTF